MIKPHTPFTILLAALMLCGPAAADVTPGREKRIRPIIKDRIIIKGLTNREGMRYVIAPLDPFAGKKPNYAVLKEGEERQWGQWGRWGSPCIYVVEDPKLDLAKLDDAWFKSEDRIVSKLSLTHESFVGSRDPTECIELTYTIGKIKGKELGVTLEKRFLDKHGKPVTKRSSMQWVWVLPLVVILAILANRFVDTIRKRRLQSSP